MTFNTCTHLHSSYARYLRSDKPKKIIEDVYAVNRNKPILTSLQIIAGLGQAALEDVSPSTDAELQQKLRKIAEASIAHVQKNISDLSSSYPEITSSLDRMQKLFASIFPQESPQNRESPYSDTAEEDIRNLNLSPQENGEIEANEKDCDEECVEEAAESDDAEEIDDDDTDLPKEEEPTIADSLFLKQNRITPEETLPPIASLSDEQLLQMIEEDREEIFSSATLCFLFNTGKHSLARAILEKIQNNEVEAEWWDNPKEKAKIFCSAFENGFIIDDLITEIDVDYKDSNEKTALSYVLEKKLPHLARILLSCGARLRYIQTQLIPSLDKKFLDDCLQESLALLELSPIVLIQYLDLGHIKEASALFQALAHRPKEKQPSWFKDLHVKAKIFDAALDAQADSATLLLFIKEGLEPNYKNPEGIHLLQKAAALKMKPVVSALLTMGAKLGAGEFYIAYDTIVENFGTDFISSFIASWDISRKESVDLICQLYFVSQHNDTIPNKKVKKLAQSLLRKTTCLWFQDAFYRTKLLTYALLAHDTDQIVILCEAGPIEPNYIYENTGESIVMLATHYANSCKKIENYEYAKKIILSLVQNGAALHYKYNGLSAFQIILNVFDSQDDRSFGSEEFATLCVRNVNIAHPSTELLICHLLDVDCPDLAWKLVCRLNDDATIVWWQDPTTKAAVFCSALANKILPIARKLAEQIDVDFEDEEGNTPLAYALHYRDKELIQSLIARGASLSCLFEEEELGPMHVCIQSIIHDLGEEFLETIFQEYSLDSKNTFMLLCNLTRENQLNYAHGLFNRLYKLAEDEQPSWWKDPKKKSYIFFNLVAAFNKNQTALYKSESTYDTYYNDLQLLANQCDLKARDTNERTPLMHAAFHNKKELVDFFIQKGALLHDTATFIISENTTGEPIEKTLVVSAFSFIVDQFSHEYAYSILQSLSLTKNDADKLLPVLVEEKHYDAAILLLARLQKERPNCWNARAKAHTFMALASSAIESATKTKLLNTLLPEIDLTEKDPRTGCTPVMAVLANKLSPTMIASMLSRAGIQLLLQQDTQASSVLEQLLTGSAPLLTAREWKLALKTLGCTDSVITHKNSRALLLAYLKKDFHSSAAPLVQRVAIAALFDDTTWIQEHFKKLSLNTTLGLIDALYELYPHLTPIVINTIFSINKAHFTQVQESIVLPPRNRNSSITDLSSFYTQYSATTNENDLNIINQFVDRVVNQIAFTGTPQANTAALKELYTRIEDATCHVVDHFKTAIQALETKYSLTLVSQENGEAKELLDRIRCYLQELVNAAGNCGPRLHTHAIEQYELIINGKKRDAKEAMIHALSTSRSFLVEELIGNDENSVHAYNEFIFLFGKELGIPGNTILATSGDPYASSYIQTAQAAKVLFEEKYTPQFLLDTLTHEFEDSASKALLDEHLMSSYATEQVKYDAQTVKIILQILFQDKALAESIRKQKLNAFLESHAFIITDTSSLEKAMGELNADYTVKEPKALYTGMRTRTTSKGLSYMPSTFLRYLATNNMLQK